ncbi:MAG TPA: hypothetical protein EYQ21_00180 [Flavobacteriales bacterium]|nr:hypothetical protein [Flavobacteriales bacterium]
MSVKRKRTYRSYEKQIEVIVKLEVDRNDFIASRLQGENADPSFSQAKEMNTKELNDLVWSTVWSKAATKLKGIDDSITIKEEV